MKKKYNRLIIAAYRIPFKISSVNGKNTLIQNSGGLVSAILSLSESMPGQLDEKQKIVWIGYSESFFEEKKTDVFSNETFEVHSVAIPDEINQRYYGGFCNSTLWPLFHYHPSITRYDEEDYNAYAEANRLFLERLKNIVQPGDLVWVHDYQLMLLPAMLRSDFADATIGFFLHIPFPTFEIFRILPTKWKSSLLNGLLGADLVGFHTSDYTNYFLNCVERELGNRTQSLRVFTDNRVVFTENFPIGIDYQKFNELSQTKEVGLMRTELFPDPSIRIIFSLDRLDYSKGLVQRLEAFETFLQDHPEWHNKVSMYMVVIPSRDSIMHYARLKHELEETIGRINGMFGGFQWRPIIYMYRSLSPVELAACYSGADVALVTPIRDGMNLVSKEFVACRINEDGVLILSDKAGSASELNGAIIINPIDRNATAHGIFTALNMTVDEQNVRMKLLQFRVRTNDVFRWAESFIAALFEAKKHRSDASTQTLTQGQFLKIKKDYTRSASRLIILDYDGTLVEFQNNPALVTPGIDAIRAIQELTQDKKNKVVILTGRGQEYISTWFDKMNVHLFAEHGALERASGEKRWYTTHENNKMWEREILPILQSFTEKAAGSFIEEKKYSVAWHYRNVEPDYGISVAGELIASLQMRITREMGIHVLHGNKVIEIRIDGNDKGNAIRRLLEKGQFDFIMSIGDDITDEDMFRAMPEGAYSFKVGFGPTLAKMNLQNPRDVISFLNKLVQIEAPVARVRRMATRMLKKLNGKGSQ